MGKVTLKSLLAHRVRLGLTTLAIVLGVGFVSGTLVLTDTMRQVFDDLVGSSTGAIDVYVRGETGVEGIGTESSYYGGTELPATLLDEILAVDGVADAAGTLDGYAQIITPEGEAIAPTGPPTLGANWLDPPLGTRIVREGGRAPATPDEVVVDERTAERHGLAVGDRVRIVFATVPPRPFTIVGISTVEGGDNLAGATLAEFDATTAHAVLGRPDAFTGIAVAAADGITPDELAAALAPVLPAGGEAVTTEAFQDEVMAQIDEALGFGTTVLSVFGGIALFVGAFLIANTFAIVVVQRTRELALLRALGASRGQVVGSLLGEAALVGLLASVVGVVAGVGLAVGLRELLGAFGMDVPGGSLVIAPRTVVLGLVVGVGVTLVAALLPARRAARVHPVEALRDAGVPAYRTSPARFRAGLLTAAVAALLVGYAAVATPEAGTLLVGVGSGLALVGVMLLGPRLTGPLVVALGGTGGRFGPVARLARRNVLRTPRRSWSTASALMIGLALVSSVAVLAASMKVSIARELDETLRADLVVTMGNASAIAVGGIPTVVAEELRAVPEVGALSPLRVGFAEVDGDAGPLLAVDATTWDQVHALEVVAGEVTATAARDTVMVDAQLAEQHGYGVGDEVPARFAASTPTLRITAVFEPDQVVSGWVVTLATYDAHLTGGLDAALLLGGADGVDHERLRAAVETAVAGFPTLQVQDQAEYRDRIAGQIDQLLALTIALLAMALLIAVLGIVNTLALSIHERTREIGVLRAVGMTRPQVHRMVRWEAVTIALLGGVAGLLLGTVLAAALLRTLADDGLRVIAFPLGQLALFVVVAAVAGALAAVLPARSAARLDVLRAVTVE